MVCFILYIIWIISSFIFSWIVFKYPVSGLLKVSFNFGAATHSHAPTLPPNIFTMNAPLTWKIAYLLETIIVFCLYLFFALSAVRLFWLYSRHVIFDLSCVKLIKRAGLALFLITSSHLICPAINTFILTQQWRNIPKALSFGTDQATLFVISLLLLVMSAIMEESYKIHDEQRLTV